VPVIERLIDILPNQSSKQYMKRVDKKKFNNLINSGFKLFETVKSGDTFTLEVPWLYDELVTAVADDAVMPIRAESSS